MDFSKLKEGVVNFSAFLVAHMAWLGTTILSVWIAYGSRLESEASQFSLRAVEALQNKTAVTLLETYGLKPLLPAIAVFFFIFILHAHRQVLARIGRYIPPELVWHYMPGLRDIEPPRWNDLLRKLGPKYEFEDIRQLIESRYKGTRKKRGFVGYSETFDMLKALAALNLFLFLLASLGTESGIWSICLFGIFTVAAFVCALLQIYHERNHSRWAIDEIVANLVTENIGKQENDLQVKDSAWLKGQTDFAERFWNADRMVPICSLSWSLPLIGNLRILKESLLRPRPAKK